MIDKPFFELEFDRRGKKIGIPGTGPGSEELGLFVLNGPHPTQGSNQYANINFTGPPGSCSGIYFSLVSQLRKWGYTVRKVDEWINVSPQHAQYYQLVVEQKRQLENTIKAGLVSAAQSVADLELVKHDMRKYEEVLKYFSEKDNHSLKAMFIDQVDIHTGEGVSLRSSAARWPTIIADFMKLRDEWVEPDKIAKELNISKAEGVILATKNRLFNKWKETFREVSIERYNNLKALIKSREKTVQEYRNWLKPYIARFKAMKLGHESTDSIKGLFSSPDDIAGQAGFSNGIKLWAWKYFSAPDIRKPAKELIDDFLIPPNDDYMVNKYIKDPKTGLANIYPDLLKPGKNGTVADDMIKEILGRWSDYGLKKDELYYVFFEFDIERVGGKIHSFEFEDITFDIRTYMMSQNVMLVKVLEMELREKEIEKYINEILGVSEDYAKKSFPELFGNEKKAPPSSAIKNYENIGSSVSKKLEPVVKFLKKRFMFAKKGIYEKDFADRITKLYLTPMGQNFFGPVKGFLIKQMGVY